MFVSVQVPIADVRRFVPVETRRLADPNWPLPRTDKDFVRAFGGVKRRRRGGVENWPGEHVYCNATHAIRCVAEQIPQCMFRRFWADGVANARIDVGLRFRQPEYDELPVAAFSQFLSATFQYQINIRDVSGAYRQCALMDIGKPLSTLFLFATTRLEAGKAFPTEAWWVQAGAPLILVEQPCGYLDSLPTHFREVSAMAPEGIQLAHCRVEFKGRRVGVWLLRNSTARCDVNTLRRLRVHLARLHTEREGIKQVLRLIAQKRIEIETKSQSSEDLQSYLDSASKLLGKEECYGLPQSAILRAAQDFEDRVTEGERETIHSQLIAIRRTVLKKVEAMTKPEAPLAGIVLNISGKDNTVTLQAEQTATMTTKSQSLNLGSGHQFHGDVNINQVAAETIQNSFNRVSNSDASNELKSALQNLSQQVTELCKRVPESKQKEVVRDLETLTNEALSPTPRKKWYELSADGLLDAAKAVVGLSEPVTAAVKTVLSLLPI